MHDEELDRALRTREDRVPLHPFAQVERRARARAVWGAAPLRPMLGVAAMAAVLVIATVVGLRLPELRRTIDPAASPAATAPPTSGESFTVTATEEMTAFTVDRGTLYAVGAGPTLGSRRIHRAVPADDRWETLYEAGPEMWLQDVVRDGRTVVIESRPGQFGPAPGPERVLLVDLGSRTTTLIDEFRLAGVRFDGGGGPAHPTVKTALGPATVAWVRLAETRDGTRTGELRVAPIADPTRSVAIATSATWLAPLAVDAQRLVYVVGVAGEDQLRVRDLRTGQERVLLTHPFPTTPPIARTALGGPTTIVTEDWAIVQVPRPDGVSVLQATHLVTGERRDALVASTCGVPRAGERFIAVHCGPQGGQVFDARTLDVLALPQGIPANASLEGSGDALIARYRTDGVVKVTVHRGPLAIAIRRPIPTVTPMPPCDEAAAQRRIRAFVDDLDRRDPGAVRHLAPNDRGGPAFFAVNEGAVDGREPREFRQTDPTAVQRYLAGRYAQQERLAFVRIEHQESVRKEDWLSFRLVVERSAADLGPTPRRALVQAMVRCSIDRIVTWQMIWPEPPPR